MKKGYFLLILLANLTIGADADHAFEIGNQLYRDGKYEAASEAYLNALNSGNESGELYYNLGNAFYKLEEYGKSRLYYEKAGKFLKNDEALQQNLDLLSMQLVDQIITPPKFILTYWWEAVLNLFPINLMTWLVLILFLIFLLSLSFQLFARSRRKRFRLVLIHRIILVVFLVCLFLLLNQIYIFESEQFAVILKPSVTIYASPDKNGTEVFILHEGTKVKIITKGGEWNEIKLDDGKTGWLEANNIGII